MAFVVGTGAAYGNHYTTEQMKAFFKKSRELDGDVDFPVEFANKVLDACGFEQHSVCLPEEKVFRRMKRSEYLEHRMTALQDMAYRAAEEALKMWGGDRSTITHFYWGTMTGAMQSPTLDIHLTKKLGLSLDVARTSIEGMGCLTGYRLLNLARETALGNPDARILVLEGDLRSAIGNSLPAKASRVDIVSSCLFRDAASSAVVSGSALKEGEKKYYEMIAGMSRIVSDSLHFVDYRELDGGGIRLHLDKGLPGAVGKAEPAFAKTLIERGRADGHDVPALQEMDIACHTGGPRVLKEVAEASGVPDEALASSYAVMNAHGNLSGASNMAVLDHHNRACETIDKWVLCISMGPGVCIEGILCKRTDTVEPEEEQEVPEPNVSQVSTRAARKSFGDATALFQGQGRRKSTLKEMADEWNKVAGEFGNA